MRRIDAVGGVLAALTRMTQAGGESVMRNVFPEWPGVPRKGTGSVADISEDLVQTVTRWIKAEAYQTEVTMCAILFCTRDFLSAPLASSRGFSAEALLDAL